MKITVTTTAQTLGELLTPLQKKLIIQKRQEESVSYALKVITGSVYMETNGQTATEENGYPINEIVIDETQLGDISLISVGGPADVRVLAI